MHVNYIDVLQHTLSSLVAPVRPQQVPRRLMALRELLRWVSLFLGLPRRLIYSFSIAKYW